MNNLKVVYSVDPCLVKLACFKPINLKSKAASNYLNHLQVHYLLHRAITFGVTHHIIHISTTLLLGQRLMEISIVPILKTQLWKEINNNFTLRLKVNWLEVLIPPCNIQALSIQETISILHLQASAISLKLRVRAYMLNTQVAMAQINLKEET